MAKLLIAVIDEANALPVPGVTREIIRDIAKKHHTVSDKIRAMQHINKHPLFIELGLKVTWRFEY